jgi:hypothetical protein
VNSVKKTRWQQSTALVSLTTCGAMTGFAFAHGTVADLTSPTSMPVHLLAASKPARQATNDSALRAAIVKAAANYLQLAQNNSPAQMEALIWDKASVGGADHGESCAAFASMVLEMGAQATGQQSWVTGGGTYPWPVHGWADVRVDPNPSSPNVVSILQDAQAHGRWHPLGDGYTPQPGDWVLFDGHVEVVTKYTGGVLYTIGGDSMPNLSVNAHQYRSPLSAQGVVGFVDNGELVTTTSHTGPATNDDQDDLGQSDIPGLLPDVTSRAQTPRVTGTRTAQAPAFGAAVIPGLVTLTDNFGSVPHDQPGGSVPHHQPGGSVPHHQPGGSVPHHQPSPAYGRHPQPATSAPTTAAQRAFISQVAPGAVAAQRRYHIPAAVTIAQAIDESGWGQSELAAQYHNLFGIKGTGPAGSVQLPTEEYENGAWVATTASFRVYYNVAESIADHSRLLANGGSYQQAMAQVRDPNSFANDLTGVYATDPDYGTNLISIMKLYNLYRYDPSPSAKAPVTPSAKAPVTPSAKAPVTPRAPQVTTQFAVADHGVNLPGLEQTGLAHGGSVSPGRSAGQPTRGVPAPRGGVAPGRSGPSGARAGASGQGGTARVGVAAAGSGRNGAGTGTSGRGGAAPGGVAGRGSGVNGGGSGGSGRGTGTPRIPGLVAEYPVTAVASASASGHAGRAVPAAGGAAAGLVATGFSVRRRPKRYTAQLPSVVVTDFFTMAKLPLARAKPLYQDVARRNNIPWQVLAACDWMQCKGQARYSPVSGEKLGTKNPDGSRYRTKSEALEQCAADLIALADAVYGIDLTAPLFLSVLELAQVFAAFRWGGLLREHRVSAMEFPYSVEGLTVQHQDLRWPDITEPNAPDKPGSRFRMPFGAVPVVLSLDYPAVA